MPNKTFTQWQALGQDTTGTVNAAAPALLTADRFQYLGRVSFFSSGIPSSAGQWQFGGGIALRVVGSTLRLFMGSYSNTDATNHQILEFTVPASYSGPATYLRSLGPLNPNLRRWGLFWDEPSQRLYSSSGTVYPQGGTTTARTITRGRIDETTGKLVSEGAWFPAEPYPYRFTQGGITAIPAWFQAQTGVGRLGVGYGGYFSIITNDPCSMGPCLGAFDPPTGASTTTGVIRGLQGYPFVTSAKTDPRGRRSTDYKQYFENYVNGSPVDQLENPAWIPIDPTLAGIGYWTWADELWGGGAWVDTPTYSGMVYLATMGYQCCWYGVNALDVPNPCSHTFGSVAAINSTARRHYLFITNPTDLAAVAAGTKQRHEIQSTFTAFPLAGIADPFLGKPSEQYNVYGMAWEPTRQVLAVGIQGAIATTPTASQGVYFFSINNGTIPPGPGPLAITTTSPLPAGQVAAVYPGATLAGSGGIPPYIWTQTGGPPGLALSTGGVLAGTPTVAGSYTLQAQMADTQALATTKPLALQVAPAPPPNDNFASAIVLGGASGSVSGTTLNATLQTGEPAGAATVWYAWTGTGTPEVFTLGGLAHRVQVYTGTTVGGLTQVADSGAGLTVTLTNTLGVLYRVRVQPQAASGAFTLTWAAIPPPAAPDSVTVF